MQYEIMELNNNLHAAINVDKKDKNYLNIIFFNNKQIINKNRYYIKTPNGNTKSISKKKLEILCLIDFALQKTI